MDPDSRFVFKAMLCCPLFWLLHFFEVSAACVHTFDVPFGCFRIMFAIAEIFLLTGAIMNSVRTTGQVDEGVTSQDEVDCAHAKKVFFAVGAAFAFLTMLSSIGYYFLQAGAESKEQPWNSYRNDAESDADPYTAHDGPHVGMTAYN